MDRKLNIFNTNNNRNNTVLYVRKKTKIVTGSTDSIKVLDFKRRLALRYNLKIQVGYK